MTYRAKSCITFVNCNKIYILFFCLDVHYVSEPKFNVGFVNLEKQELLHGLKFKTMLPATGKNKVDTLVSLIFARNGNG
jgi:hypothetical protein